MRARGIKPGFFRNEVLADLDPYTRLLFAGLWCCADREGRMEDRPRRIKADVFPYEDIDVDVHLWELSKSGFIVRYEVDGCRYIEVCNFVDHQSPHVKEAPSTIPAPDDSGASTRQTPDGHPLIPSSLTPSSLTPDSLTPGQKVRDHSSIGRKKVDVDPAEFESFWSLYPRKESKGTALRAWGTARKKASAAVIVSALRSQLSELQGRERQFQPLPATWLNGERWADENGNGTAAIPAGKEGLFEDALKFFRSDMTRARQIVGEDDRLWVAVCQEAARRDHV